MNDAAKQRLAHPWSSCRYTNPSIKNVTDIVLRDKQRDRVQPTLRIAALLQSLSLGVWATKPWITHLAGCRMPGGDSNKNCLEG